MPSCVLETCHNHADKVKKVDGVTYHTFPTAPEVRLKWINIVRANRRDSSWLPNVCSSICSKHFDADALYITKNGLRRIVRGGCPTKFTLNEKQFFPPISDIRTQEEHQISASAVSLGANNKQDSPSIPLVLSEEPPVPVHSFCISSNSNEVHSFCISSNSNEMLRQNKRLTYELQKCRNKIMKQARTIKTLKQKIRRTQKSQHKLKTVIDYLLENGLINDETRITLDKNLVDDDTG